METTLWKILTVLPKITFVNLCLCVCIIGFVPIRKMDASVSSQEDITILNMSRQLIQGKLMTSFDGRPFLGFMGLPYALPPVGLLRFSPPQPMTPDFSLFQATTERLMCPQYLLGTDTVIGDEDCLYLNVYTHFRVSLVPVLVVLHGGAFTSGHGGISDLGPDYLMDRNLVLVTLNYRLGALGFLSTGDSELPGNYGLKDQLQALRWVKKNIEYFGGDVDRITLYGFNSGGASAQYHLLSPSSKGLFHRIFYQSGSALNFWAFQHHPISVARKVASLVGCPSNSTSKDMVACLMKKPAYDLVRTLYHFSYWVQRLPFPFGPVLEFQESVEDPPFLTKHPETILESGVYNHVPTIAGVVHDECIALAWEVFNNESLLVELDTDFSRVVSLSMNLGHLPRDTVKKIRQFYFEDEPIRNASLRTLIRLFSDCKMTQGVCWAAREQMASSYAPVYFFRFNYKGRISTFMVGGTELLGTSHGDELFYIFKRPQHFPDSIPTFEERANIIRWGKLLSNFAATGNPIPEETLLFPELWYPLVKKKKFRYLDIGVDLSMKENQRLNARLEFWDTIVKDVRRQAYKSRRDEL